MKRLHELDEVAYVRFASVYRSFKDVGDFVSAVKSLLDLSAKREKEAQGAKAEGQGARGK